MHLLSKLNNLLQLDQLEKVLWRISSTDFINKFRLNRFWVFTRSKCLKILLRTVETSLKRQTFLSKTLVYGTKESSTGLDHDNMRSSSSSWHVLLAKYTRDLTLSSLCLQTLNTAIRQRRGWYDMTQHTITTQCIQYTVHLGHASARKTNSCCTLKLYNTQPEVH